VFSYINNAREAAAHSPAAFLMSPQTPGPPLEDEQASGGEPPNSLKDNTAAPELAVRCVQTAPLHLHKFCPVLLSSPRGSLSRR